MKKIAILAALTGGIVQDREGATIPTTPEAIAEAAFRCHQAGASIIHIHARDENNVPSADPELFADIISRIRSKCDVLVQTTNGIGSRFHPETGAIVRPSDDERMQTLNDNLDQELFSIGGGTWDFEHPNTPRNKFPSITSESLMKKYISKVKGKGKSVEIEVVQLSFIERLRRFADEGLFDPDGTTIWLNYSFGFGGLKPTAQDIHDVVVEGKTFFPKAKWQVTATDRSQFKMNTFGVLMDCDIVRVGFEDNIYLPNGKPAKHNHDLVEAMAGIIRQFGREVATADDVRQMFALSK